MDYSPVISAPVAWHDCADTALWLDAQFDLAAPAQGWLNYRQQHMVGAYHVDLEQHLSSPASAAAGRHPLPEGAALAAHLSAIGYTPKRPVRVYDGGDMVFAARAWMTLRWLGIADVSVVDGGLPALVAAGAPLTQALPHPPPTQAGQASPVRFGPSHQALINQSALQQDLPSAPWLLIDARAPDRFNGTPNPLDPRCGHMPGALNRFYQDNLQPNGCLLPLPELQRQWQTQLGAATPDQVIHYCGSGVSACVNLLAMAQAGLPGSRLYVGSWSQWAANPLNPIAM